MTSSPLIIAWLDLTKSVDTIEVWYTHPQITHPSHRSRQQHMQSGVPFPQIADVQFISLILHYSDGTTSAIGPQQFDDMYKHPEKHEADCECHVYYEGSRDPTGKKLPFKLHYHSEDWQVGGRKIALLRVWASIFLAGLQFIADDGSESPYFGHCNGDPSGTIIFGEGHAVGLKIFSDANSRPVTKQDVVLMGLQALSL